MLLYDAPAGLLSPEDKLMALFSGLSNAGAMMAQPGLSKGQAFAMGMAGLGQGMAGSQRTLLQQRMLEQQMADRARKQQAAEAFAKGFETGPEADLQLAALARFDPVAASKLASANYGKAPETVEAYDKSGNPIKMQWDRAARQYVPLGGAKIDPDKLQRGEDGTYSFLPGVVPSLAAKERDIKMAGVPAAIAEKAGTAPIDAWLKWQGPQQQQPGANILDLSSAGPSFPGRGASGAPPLVGQAGQPPAPSGAPRTVVKAPQEWGADPGNPGLQVSRFTGERRAIPPGVTDDKEAAKNAIVSTDRAIASAQELLQHPGRQAATGKSFPLGYVWGTDAYDFGAKLETLKAQVWLPEVEKMKGMGALSNAEGAKLTAAFQSLDPKMTEEGFYKSLTDAVTQLKEARDRFLTKALTGYMPPPSAAQGPRFLGFE